MSEHCGSSPTVEEEEAAFGRARDERIESLYQGWSARDMAERIVDLEDELGEDVDGMCTGMHAEVAEAQCAWRDMRAERDRYRLAWLSARRRAADESNFATEALALKDAEMSRLRALVDEVQAVRGWTICASTARDLMESHLRPVYDSLYELEESEREGRPYRDRWTRTGHESMADMCPRCDMVQDSLPQPTPCTCDDESATVAYWKAELERVYREGNASRLAQPERS
ncbi:hypothetical protein [Streptomyces scopuliridis]|uniref:Uncharacterized protein n=1 Tax=Streptomyces scopuliridis TaxID=452529 RepID=A0ACD4ZS25_9ACTN|nr:hypothetical protein [Streptomyces scopuliridis]WSC01241.1 hypothetical protein OG835_32420 [Streptomyces scopuliridis]